MIDTSKLDLNKPADVRKSFAYVAGTLICTENGKGMRKGRRKAGRYSVGRYRYYSFELNGHRYYEHRLVWIYHNGRIPKHKVIAHSNGDTMDNRIENLRLDTRGKVVRKTDQSKLRGNNSSGYVGVSFNKQRQKWVARISHKGRAITLVESSSKEEAIRARQRAEKISQKGILIEHKDRGGVNSCLDLK